jgi:outer membrane lipoprotein-sorting protein
MKKIITNLLIGIAVFSSLSYAGMTGEEIIRKLDENYAAENRRTTARMTVHGRRRDVEMSSVSWIIGNEKSFTEYLSPARQKGTKMLKVGDELWIYSPDADRIIKIAGHMLKKSMMGSDLSYEDMMEDYELLDVYDIRLMGEELLDEKECYKLELIAKEGKEDISYKRRVVWVDKDNFLPLKEEMYAKSGKLLKRFSILETMRIGKRWYPKKMVFKDVLSKGKGTVFEIDSIEFDLDIPDSLFSKASLRK